MQKQLTHFRSLFFLGLFIFAYSATCQSFFTANTLPGVKNYGQISTRHLPQKIVQSIQRKDFSVSEWATFFNIRSADGSSVSGNYLISNDQLIFVPDQSPDSLSQYIITFSYPNLNLLMQNSLSEQAVFSDIVSFKPPKSSQPEVVSFIPNLDQVPANLLRFYVSFSSPMGSENPYDFISILDKNGEPLDKPFVIAPEGLWNIDRTRLTLLMHPKQEVSETVQGDVLLVGNSYTLKIDENWKGASGEPLKRSFSQVINATNPLRGAMNINSWALKAEVGNIGVLKVITDHPLDQPLAKRMLFIRNAKGQILPARVEFDNSEQLRILWRLDGSKELELLIDPRLEDVCGNTPHYAFDLAGTERSLSKEELKIKFRAD